MLRIRYPILLCIAAVYLCQVGCTAHRASVSEVAQGPKAAPIRLTIVGTNDLHGWIGGLPTFAGYLSILRADNPGGTLLLDAGDLFQGTLAANLTEGAVVIDAYNYLGYQATAIGNHEFDYGPEGPASVALQPGDDPVGALKARLRQAKFSMLAVNLYDWETRDPAGWLYHNGSLLFERKRVKVRLLGLLSP